MALHQGTLLSNTSGRTAELMPEIRRRLVKIHSKRSKFLTFLMGQTLGKGISPIPQEPAGNGGVFQWFERSRNDYYTTTSAQATAAATTLTVTDYTIFHLGDIVEVTTNPGGTTGEKMWVSATPTTTSLAVQARGMFGTTANIIYSGARITRLGGAIPEKGVTTIGSAVGGPTNKWGACQELRKELESSSRRRSSETYTGFDWIYDQADQIADLKEEAERTLLFNGVADKTTTATGITGTPLIYTTAGLMGYIVSNNWDCGGNMTYDDFVDRLGNMQIDNNGAEWNPMMLASQRVMRHLGSWGMDPNMYNTSSKNNDFGFSIGMLRVMGIEQNDIPIMQVPALDGSIMDNGFFIIDTSKLTLRYMQEGPPDNYNWSIRALGDNDQGIDMTTVGAEKELLIKKWMTCIGLELHQEIAFARVTGVSSRFF